METRKYKILEYLSQADVGEIAKSFSLFQKWNKVSDFGFKYYYTRVKKFDADRKNNTAFLNEKNGKHNEVVFLCKAKDKYWFSLNYGHSEHLDSPLVLKHSGLWFSNSKKWERICQTEGE